MAFKQKIRVQPQAIQDTALMSLETKKKKTKTKTFSIILENAKLHFKKKEIFFSLIERHHINESFIALWYFCLYMSMLHEH